MSHRRSALSLRRMDITSSPKCTVPWNSMVILNCVNANSTPCRNAWKRCSMPIRINRWVCISSWKVCRALFNKERSTIEWWSSKSEERWRWWWSLFLYVDIERVRHVCWWNWSIEAMKSSLIPRNCYNWKVIIVPFRSLLNHFVYMDSMNQ